MPRSTKYGSAIYRTLKTDRKQQRDLDTHNACEYRSPLRPFILSDIVVGSSIISKRKQKSRQLVTAVLDCLVML